MTAPAQGTRSSGPRRKLAAVARRVFRPLVVRIRWVAGRLDLGGVAEADAATRAVGSLRASLATLEVTVAEQADELVELRAEVERLRAQLDDRSPASA